MYQYQDHHPESDDNIDAHNITSIITDLAQYASQDKESINSTFINMISKIKALRKQKQWKRKAHNATVTITINVIAGHTIELEIISTPVLRVITQRLATKITQHSSHVKEVPIYIVMTHDE